MQGLYTFIRVIFDDRHETESQFRVFDRQYLG